jgi:hypothetical protein
MAQPKSCIADIPAIYRADTIDHILLGYVRGCKSCQPERSIADITLSFLQDFDLEQTFDEKSAEVAFQRVNAKLRENYGKI